MADLRDLIRRFRQVICFHAWRPTKYQALVPGTSYECSKCGKIEYRSRSRALAKEGRT